MATNNIREEILMKLVKTIANDEELKEHEVALEEVPCTGINYTAAIYLITIKDKEKDEDISLFAKVAMANEMERHVLQTVEMFIREEFIYKEITKIYNDLQDRHEVRKNRYVFPKFYASHSFTCEETIILENLSVKGYFTPDRFKSMDWSLAARAVEQLANFHAMSFAFQYENSQLFNELVKGKVEYIFTRSGVCPEAISKYTKERINTAMECLTSENAESFRKFINKTDPNVGHRNQFQLQGRPCLVHGDFKQGNVLVKSENGVISDLIIVDYQCVHYGSPINDLLYLIFTGTDEGFRSQHYKNLTNHYYSCLADSLINYKLKICDVYPREEFDRDLQEREIYGVYIGLFILPFTLAEKKPDFGQKTVITVNNSVLYKERFNGIINDFIKWGYL